MRGTARICCLILRVLLTVAFATWAAAAPLVWILRDGLAPGMVETAGAQAVYKFLLGWGVPALVLVAALYGTSAAERRLTTGLVNPSSSRAP